MIREIGVCSPDVCGGDLGAVSAASRRAASWRHPSLCPPPPRKPRSSAEKIAVVLEMIKFRHTVFALPFALVSMLVAAGGWPRATTFFWVLVACVAARSMAMAYNRLADRRIDARNPRTRNRALPIRLVSAEFTWRFVLASAAAFVFAAAMLNTLCLVLSPLAILILIGYSHSKRFTPAVHVLLGVALGLAPAGAWIAVRGSLEGLPVFLVLGVVFWVAGFDVIYSCLDVACDRLEGLCSLPARAGVAPALRGSAILHAFSILSFALFLVESSLGFWSWAALVVNAGVLVGEHRQVGPDDLSRVGPAFFSFNALVSVLFLIGCAIDVLA